MTARNADRTRRDRPDRPAARPRRAALALLAGMLGALLGARREAAANTPPPAPAPLPPVRRARRRRTGQAAPRQATGPRWVGLAAWYGAGFAGRRTASGERFDPGAMAAAHRTLPFGTRVRVTSLDTGRSVVVRINDRGPHTPGRIIDLTEAAARRIGLRARGVGRVRIERLA